MRGVKTSLLHIGLDALYFSGVYHLMAPATSGVGAIFMLHRVRATQPDVFAPNRGLEIAPEFLDRVLTRLGERGIDVVDLDEAMNRLHSAHPRRFAVFTFDDGYADNLDAALPVFEAHAAPFTIYVTTGLIDGTADIWWLVLEEAIQRLPRLRLTLGEREFDLPAATAAQKQAAWDAIYWPIRDLSVEQRWAAVKALGEQAGVSTADIFASLAPSWERLSNAAKHPLLTIGAHTITHRPLSALSSDEARHEIRAGRDVLEDKIGRKVRHFAYPFGDLGSAGAREFQLTAELGFSSAVTTQRGPLFAQHAATPYALPRISLNGNYQSMRYVELFLSGAPFALFNGLKKRAA